MNILLITGAIDVLKYNTPFTHITNANIRLQQYIESIEYALISYKEITHIVFCENTAFLYNYDTLKEKAVLNGKILEVLSFKGDHEKIKRYGKGFGEGEIIKYATTHSEIMCKFASFYKLTGRLKIKNFDAIIKKSLADNYFIYYPASIYSVEKNYISTVFFKVARDFYEKVLFDVYHDVHDDEGCYLEHLFLLKLSKHKINCFDVFPMISGVSGSSGINYDNSKGKQLIEYVLTKLGVHNLNQSKLTRLLVRIIAKLKVIFNR